MELTELCKSAKEVSRQIGNLDTNTKNEVLRAAAEAHTDEIIRENEKDLARGRENHMPEGLLDRLMLTPSRMEQMAEGLRQVADLADPIGEVLSMKKRPNGLMIGKKRVPLGVVGMIYEARPNVTVDAFALCFKTGNAVILKGGSDAILSNIVIVSVLQEVLEAHGIPRAAVSLIEDTSRETAAAFMKMNEYVDVLIPRGGAGLINSVVQNSTVPVIQTGVGNCHVFVDESADLEKAARIVINAKTQRPGVCNACESLLVHEAIAEKFMPEIGKALQERKVEIRGDKATQGLVRNVVPATEADWATEYEDYIISARVVKDIDEAIRHIRKYSTGHSEAIVTENYTNAQRFLNEVDAAAVYVNASTRFTDGGQFGFGAEIGISTQKLHARGPMGLKELTTTKYIIYGNGQIRE